MSSSFTNVSLSDSGICYRDIFRYEFQANSESAFNGNLQGSCRDASGEIHPWARVSSVTSIDDCKSKCENELIPLNTDNAYRGVNFRSGTSQCYCLFDNAINVPSGGGWDVRNNRPGSGPVTQHSGEPNFHCVPVVECLNQATIAVGASGDYNDGYIGGAYIYESSDGVDWDLQEKLTTSGVSKVAISGDTLATGLGNADGGCGTRSGFVRVYHRSGHTWTQQASITDPDCGTYNSFGSNMDIQNDMLVVGQPQGGDSGRVYAFRRSSNDTWPLIQQFEGFYEYHALGSDVVFGDDYHFMTKGYPEPGGSYYYGGNSGLTLTSDGASPSPQASPQDLPVYMVDLFVSRFASFVYPPAHPRA